MALDFPTSVSGVTLSTKFSPAAVHVTITRPVQSTFMRFFGRTSTNVKVTATAAVVNTASPVPILVLDPTGSPSFSMKGTPSVTICGGPQRSLQVNSNASGALSVKGSATVDLSKAGPQDGGNCTTGTGGDFAVFGGGSSTPSWLTPTGTGEHYVQPAAPFPDPFSSVAPPSKPAAAVVTTTGFGASAGQGDCPSAARKGCTIYNPGYYSSAISISNTTAIFQPGIYYMDAQLSNGANGIIIPCATTCVADTSGCCTTGNGVMIYFSSKATKGVLDEEQTPTRR